MRRVLPMAPGGMAGPLEVRLAHGRNENYLVGRFALDTSASAPAAPMQPGDAERLAALRIAPGKRDAAQRGKLDEAFAAVDKKRAAKAVGTDGESLTSGPRSCGS